MPWARFMFGKVHVQTEYLVFMYLTYFELCEGIFLVKIGNIKQQKIIKNQIPFEKEYPLYRTYIKFVKINYKQKQTNTKTKET